MSDVLSIYHSIGRVVLEDFRKAVAQIANPDNAAIISNNAPNIATMRKGGKEHSLLTVAGGNGYKILKKARRFKDMDTVSLLQL